MDLFFLLSLSEILLIHSWYILPTKEFVRNFLFSYHLCMPVYFNFTILLIFWSHCRLHLVGLSETCKEFVPFFGFVAMLIINFWRRASYMLYYCSGYFCDVQYIWHFSISIQIRLRDYGVLDFDAGDARRQPPVDTTWQQVLNTNFILFFNLFIC